MTHSLLVVDDHQLIRLGVRSMLAGSPICVAAEATSLSEVASMVNQQRFDVALVDIRMPSQVDGFRILEHLKCDVPYLPVVMYSAFEFPSYLSRAHALGAAGFVLKSDPRERLIQRLQDAIAGKSLWTKEELRRASFALSPSSNQRATDLPLTQRETEILKLLSLGKTNKRIAGQLQISYETVKEHVQNILKKIGVTDRTQAAIWAVRQKLV